ncbi:MAG: regulatory protein RecX [Dehalococcoidia bacterium]
MAFHRVPNAMGVITDIKEQKRRKDRVSVFVDGRYALGMSRLSLIKSGLVVGQEVSGDQVLELEAEAQLEEALNVAGRFLGYRPRSEREVRSRLRRRGFDEDVVERAVARLRERGLLDDTEFARFWKENRVAFSPRSRRLLEQELRRKGVDVEVVAEVSADVEDSEEAYRAGHKKARSLPLGDYTVFHRRMMSFLKGRGFGYATASETARRLWQEAGEQEEI